MIRLRLRKDGAVESRDRVAELAGELRERTELLLDAADVLGRGMRALLGEPIADEHHDEHGARCEREPHTERHRAKARAHVPPNGTRSDGFRKLFFFAHAAPAAFRPPPPLSLPVREGSGPPRRKIPVTQRPCAMYHHHYDRSDEHYADREQLRVGKHRRSGCCNGYGLHYAP